MQKMSAFIRELETIFNEQKIRSGSKIFAIAGYDRSMLSRIRAGARVQLQVIPRIAAAIGSDPLIFQRLLYARLVEECKDRRADRIRIELTDAQGGVTLHDAALPFADLPPKQASAIQNIVANLPTDAGLRQTILWLGNEVFAPETLASGSLPLSLDPDSDARVKAATTAAAEFAAGGKSYRAKRRASKLDAAPPPSSHSGTVHGPGHPPKP